MILRRSYTYPAELLFFPNIPTMKAHFDIPIVVGETSESLFNRLMAVFQVVQAKFGGKTEPLIPKPVLGQRLEKSSAEILKTVDYLNAYDDPTRPFQLLFSKR